MGRRQPQAGWRIAQVERLTGLSRRDIQRACYEGKGGAAILKPADGSWGRRAYDREDLAKLFVVKRYKEQGLSLPEIKQVFQEAQECSGYRGLLNMQAWRLRDELERIATQLVDALALLKATGSESDTQLDELAQRMAARQLLEAELGSDETAPKMNAVAPIDRTREAARFVDTCRALAETHRQGNAPDSVPAQEAAARYLDALAGGAAHELAEYLLDAPGMELVLELRFGPGAFEFMKEALGAREDAERPQ